MPCLDGRKHSTFNLSLGWCMMDHDFQSYIQVLTPLFIHIWVHECGWYIIAQATKYGNNIHTGHIAPQGSIIMDGRIIIRHFHHLHLIECDVSWAPTIQIHTGIDSTATLWISACCRLIHHCTSNQAKGSNIYWPHNEQIIGHHKKINTGTLLASTMYGVWCTMNSSHYCMSWWTSRILDMCMGDIGPRLPKQQDKRITSILVYTKVLEKV